MTLKDMMLQNIQTSQSTAIMQLGAQPSQMSKPSGSSAFGEIYGSKIASADRQSYTKKNDPSAIADRSNSENAAVQDNNKPKYLTYREASRNNLKETSSETYRAKAMENKDRSDEIEDDSKEKAARNKTQNNTLQALAQVLGLNMQELQNLLKEAGINPDSLNNPDSISENVSKLSQMLGLNDEQKGTLEKLLGLTAEVSQSAGTAPEVSGIQSAQKDETLQVISKDLAETPSSSGTDQEAVQAKQEMDALMEKLSADIKAKLNELGSKLENDQGAVEDELRQIMQQVSSSTAAKIQDSLKTNNDANVTNAQDPKVTEAAGAENASAKNGETGKEADGKTDKAAAAPQPVSAVKAGQPQTVFTVAQPDKALDTEVIEKATTIKTPVEPKEILSQVIENAKVILTPDKSEMVMDLKPDSLGKISLKVITENGMVMAKFVAENQQVKQVLESNMQLLKDSLEKQGLNVQGFSVSVRQDSNQTSERWANAEGSKSRSIGRAAYRGTGIEGGLTAAAEVSSRNNPYAWSGSTINFTA